MPPSEQKIDRRKFNGGKRNGAGAKKGVTAPAVIARKEQREVTLRDIEQQIQARAGKIVDALTVNAYGYHKMVVVTMEDGIPHTRTVVNPAEMQRLLDEGEYGKDYKLVVAAKPDTKAGEALLNRGFGKARESIVHSGGVGVLHLIKNLNSSDGAGGQTED